MSTNHLCWKNLFGDELYNVNLNLRDTDRIIEPHTHDFPQLLYVTKGVCLHSINAVRQQLIKGDLVLVRASDTHAFRSGNGRRYSLLIISFPAEVVQQFGRQHFNGSIDFWGGTGRVPFVYHLGDNLAGFHNRLLRAASIPKTTLVRDSLLLNLLYCMQENSDAAVMEPSNDIPQWLKRACADIRIPANMREGVSAFVRLACRSHEHVARQTRRYVGKSPVEIVNHARIESACRRLATEDTNIEEIAADVGFPSPPHFYRVFLAETGNTPRAYRNKHRKDIF